MLLTFFSPACFPPSLFSRCPAPLAVFCFDSATRQTRDRLSTRRLSSERVPRRVDATGGIGGRKGFLTRFEAAPVKGEGGMGKKGKHVREGEEGGGSGS